jgi:hypothetical protein
MCPAWTCCSWLHTTVCPGPFVLFRRSVYRSFCWLQVLRLWRQLGRLTSKSNFHFACGVCHRCVEPLLLPLLLLQVLRVIEAQLGRLTSEVVWRGLVTTCLAGVIASSWATAGGTDYASC